MGNNSLFMEYPNNLDSNKNKLYYTPFSKSNIPYVYSPETLYTLNNINHNLNNISNNTINHFITPKKIIDNDNSIRKNNTTLEISNNNNHYNINDNNNQKYFKNCPNVIKNYNHKSNQPEQLKNNFNSKNLNIKVIHTKAYPIITKDNTQKEIPKQLIENHKTYNSNLIFNNISTSPSYYISKNNNNNIHNNNNNNNNSIYNNFSKNNKNNIMKTSTSIISNLHFDSFNSLNESMISPMYYTSSVPLTATTPATTTASIKSINSSSLVNSYFGEGDEQYLVNDNNTITYIINSNSSHNEKTLSTTPHKNNTLVNTVSPSSVTSTSVSYSQNPPDLNTTTNGSSNNDTQVKSLVPIKYYTNSFFTNGRFFLNSTEMTNSIATSNSNTSILIDTTTPPSTHIINSNSANPSANSTAPANFYTEPIVIKSTDDEENSFNINLQQLTNTNSSSPSRKNSIRNATEPTYTNLEKEKVRGPMMYSTASNSTNVMNISSVVANIISNNSNTPSNHQTTANVNNTSTTTTNSSGSTNTTNSTSTISILSSASSVNNNMILKDTGVLTCSPGEADNIHQAIADKKSKPPKSSSKHLKRKSSVSVSDKSGIIGFAAEILTSVLPTSSNDLKHPKTRYLPELYPFIKKIARKCKLDIRTFLYALVYSQRFAEALLSRHKEAVGEYGTNHRIFLGSILLAYQYQIDHGMKVNFKLDAKKLSKYTDGVWTEKEVEMMCKALLSTKNFKLDIDDDVVKQFVETHKTDLCWYS